MLTVAKWRPALVLCGLGLAFLGLAARAVYLQVVPLGKIPEGQRNAHLIKVKLPAHRGPVTDRHGEFLAVSMPVDSVWVDTAAFFPGGNDRVEALSEAIGYSSEHIQRRLSRYMHMGHVSLRRHMPPKKAARVMALNVPGVYLRRDYRRFYPRGPISGHVLGFTNVDDEGQEGLELAYDAHLRSRDGLHLMVRNRLGQIVSGVRRLKPSKPGASLTTTLDLRIQHLAFQALAEAMEERSAKSGSVVVLDVATGEILAMVNHPVYNPNDRSQLLVELYRNRAVTDIFEPGSSLKPFIAAAALESGRYTSDSIVDTAPGRLIVGNKEITDPRSYGPLSMGGILQKSSNVGISKVALDLESRELWSVLVRLGFGSLTTSGFPGESAGLLNSYVHWRPLQQATLAYGYGLSVTPLQLAQAYAVIGAQGVRYPVTFVRRDKPVRGERVLSESTAEQLLAMLETVVAPEGTGHRARLEAYRVAGKTLTARKYAAGGYSTERHVTGFAGVAPASSPRLAVVVVIDEPEGTDNSGGKVAAPVFADVMRGALRMLAVAPDQAPARTAEKAIREHVAVATAGEES
ncbi:MAG: penicillin-binding transpeptidase domain-containing protein [Pseudomonadota bacterium]